MQEVHTTTMENNNSNDTAERERSSPRPSPAPRPPPSGAQDPAADAELARALLLGLSFSPQASPANTTPKVSTPPSRLLLSRQLPPGSSPQTPLSTSPRQHA